jgi:hypothetical protein
MLEVRLSRGRLRRLKAKQTGVLYSSRFLLVRLRGSEKGKRRQAKRKGKALQRRQGTDLSGHRVLKSQSGKKSRVETYVVGPPVCTNITTSTAPPVAAPSLQRESPGPTHDLQHYRQAQCQDLRRLHRHPPAEGPVAWERGPYGSDLLSVMTSWMPTVRACIKVRVVRGRCTLHTSVDVRKSGNPCSLSARDSRAACNVMARQALVVVTVVTVNSPCPFAKTLGFLLDTPSSLSP